MIFSASYRSDFESMLQIIKWPYMGSASTELMNPSKDALNKLVSAAEYLFLVKMNIQDERTIECAFSSFHETIFFLAGIT